MKKLIFISFLCTCFAFSLHAAGLSMLRSVATGSASSMMGGSASMGGGFSGDFSGGGASGLAAINPNSIGAPAQSYSSGAMSPEEAAQYASSQGLPGFSATNDGWGGSASYPAPQGQFLPTSNYNSQNVTYPPGTAGQPLLGPDGLPLLGPDGQPLMAPAGAAGQPNIVINTGQPSAGGSSSGSSSVGGTGMGTGEIVGTSVGGAGAAGTIGALGLMARRRRGNANSQAATAQVDPFGNPVLAGRTIDSKTRNFGKVVTKNGVDTIKKASAVRQLFWTKQRKAEYDAEVALSQQKLDMAQDKVMGLDPLSSLPLMQHNPNMPLGQTPPPPVVRTAAVDSEVVPFGSRITTKDGKESIKIASKARQLTWSDQEKTEYQRLLAESEQDLAILQTHNVSKAAAYRKAGLTPPPTAVAVDIAVLPYGSLITKANGQESIKTASAARQLAWTEQEKELYKRRTAASTAALKTVKAMTVPTSRPALHSTLLPNPKVIQGRGLTTPLARQRIIQHPAHAQRMR